MRRFLKFNKIFGLLPVFMAAVLINATPAMAGGTISFEKVDIGFNSAIGAGFVQDRDGFFWIGTQTGLIKWNGTDRVIYSRSRGGLSDNTITAVVEDHKGQLWVGTMGGLNRYSKDIDTFLQFKHNPDDANSLSHESIGMINHFQSLIEDKDGYLWIATQNGLNRFDPEEGIFKHFLHRPDNPGSLSHNVVNAIYADSTGTLWVGTRSGLNRLDPTRTAFERYAHDPGNSTSLSHNEVHAVMEDGAGDIWIGTENGLNKFHKDSNSFVRYFHSPADHSIVADSKITSINRDKKGRLWLCHYTKGSFTLFDPGTHQAEFYIHDPENPDSLPTNDAKYVYEDRQGVIWVVSTTGGNICKHDVNSTKFVTYKQNRHNPHSLNGNSVLPIYEDSRGTLWIGTDKSKLNKYDRKTGRFTYIPIQGHHPYAFCEDSRGTFWVGETNGRLSIFDRRSETYLKSYDGLTSSFISHIAQDTQDPSILWLTTHKDGLVKFNTRTEEFKHFRHQPGAKSSLSNNSVWGFWQTDDTLWLGTWGGGLNEFHKEKEVFTVYKHDPDDPASISSNTSGNLLMTSAGDLYISTLGGGLNRFNKATRTFEHYSKSNDRFPSDDLTGLLEDTQGNLWIASSTEEVIRFDVRTKAFEIFGPADGIEIGGPWFVANHKTRDGQMWFGGPKGVTAFYPKNIQHNDFRPPVYITALTQGGAPIQTDRALERLSRIDLAWKKPFFEFKATALNYTRSENNRYRYKLEGWDADWFEAGVLRNGRYSNLPGGAYTLKIEGSNNDGLWCRPEQAVAVTVFVSRPFWKTGWFYLALGCVFLMVIGFALKYLAKLRFEIGERKQAEEALGASEKVVRDILENSRDILYKFNLKTGTYDYMSPSLEKYTGISVADYIEGGIELALSRIHPEDRVKLKTHIKHLLDKKFEDDMDPTIEYRFKNLDGKYRWFSDNRSVLRDEDDNALGVIGSNRDITSNKLAEEALSKQRYFLQKAQEMGKIGTWELDIEKNELLWTDETYKIFGLPVGTKLTYETFLDCVHPEDRQYVNTEWKASVAGKPYDIEHRLLIGGETKWV
ncbi:MAG: PAS domain-containing protein, partial [Desulfobacterales bacterium]|nr:PAS domain-containing protein [Desulfobacterales bacterium]